MKKPSLCLILNMLAGILSAQIVQFSPAGDSTAKLSIEGYLDTYYGFDFSEPGDKTRLYCVSQSRHNEFNINLAYVSLRYTSDRVRATFTPGFGTYMNSNYASEKATLRNIVEAGIGVKPFRNRKIWIDAGVMGTTPYTNESAISFDQLIYTRPIASEYVPYYQTGVRLTLPVTGKLNLYLFLLNGWQVIEDNNTPLAFGSQFEYKPKDKLTLCLNTYYGYEGSASAPSNRMRMFLDFYTLYSVGKLDLTLSTYAGNQQREDSLENRSDNVWWQGNVTARYNITKRHSISARTEYFNDPHSVMITPVTGADSFRCSSYSAGYNVAITPKVLWRAEARYFLAQDKVFLKDGAPVNNNLLLITGLTAKF